MRKNPNWFEKICSAACICLTDEELMRLAVDVGEELRDLSEISFEGISERWQESAVGMESLREDQTGECLDRADLLAPSALHSDTCFLVPRVLGNEGEKS